MREKILHRTVVEVAGGIFVAFLILSAEGIRAQTPFEEGVRLFQNEQFPEAHRKLEQAVTDNPTHAEAASYLGQISYRQENYTAAIDWFKKAVQLDNRNSDYHLWLGRAYGRKAQTANIFHQLFLAPKVQTQFETAVALNPDNVAARWALMEYYLEAPAAMGGSHQKAEEQAREIQRRDADEGQKAWKRIAEAEGQP